MWIPIRTGITGLSCNRPLCGDGGVDPLDGAAEDAEGSVTIELDNLPAVLFDGLAERVPMTVADALSPMLILLHQGREAHHVGEHDGRESSHV
jgi:hypothetical protein